MVLTRGAHAIPEAEANAPEAPDFAGSEQRTRLGRGRFGIERGSDNSVARSLPGGTNGRTNRRTEFLPILQEGKEKQGQRRPTMHLGLYMSNQVIDRLIE